MKSVRFLPRAFRFALVAAFLSLPLAEGFHNHRECSGGLSRPHVDCAYCLFAHPGRTPAHVSTPPTLEAAFRIDARPFPDLAVLPAHFFTGASARAPPLPQA